MAMNREVQEYTQKLLGAETFADLSEKKYEKRLGKLRADLMKTQRKLRDAPNPIVIVIAGVDGAGKGQAIQLLNEWLDPRDLSARSFWDLSEEALQRPRFWRYWNALPRRGKLSLWFGGWYSALLTDGVDQRLSKAEWEENLKDVQNQVSPWPPTAPSFSSFGSTSQNPSRKNGCAISTKNPKSICGR